LKNHWSSLLILRASRSVSEESPCISDFCAYCHDDEHSRGLLGDYLKGGGRGEDGG